MLQRRAGDVFSEQLSAGHARCRSFFEDKKTRPKPGFFISSS